MLNIVLAAKAHGLAAVSSIGVTRMDDSIAFLANCKYAQIQPICSHSCFPCSCGKYLSGICTMDDRYAKEMGYDGSISVTAEQAEICHVVFKPSRTELMWADKILRTVAGTNKGVMRMCDHSARVFVGPPHICT